MLDKHVKVYIPLSKKQVSVWVDFSNDAKRNWPENCCKDTLISPVQECARLCYDNTADCVDQ